MRVLVSVNPSNACDTPQRFLGSICDVVSVNKRLALTTVRVYDHLKDREVLLEVDSHCVERPR